MATISEIFGPMGGAAEIPDLVREPQRRVHATIVAGRKGTCGLDDFIAGDKQLRQRRITASTQVVAKPESGPPLPVMPDRFYMDPHSWTKTEQEGEGEAEYVNRDGKKKWFYHHEIDPKKHFPRMFKKGSRRVIKASKKILAQFERVGKNTLVHKSTKDLWAVGPNNTLVALYDPEGEPLEDTDGEEYGEE